MPTDEEVTAALNRLIANAFGGYEARLSIPARPDYDDDLVVGRWVLEAQALLERCRVMLCKMGEPSTGDDVRALAALLADLETNAST